MKKIPLLPLIASLSLISLLASCASARCDCETNRPYRQKKPRTYLINHQKKTTFVAQNEGKNEQRTITQVLIYKKQIQND